MGQREVWRERYVWRGGFACWQSLSSIANAKGERRVAEQGNQNEQGGSLTFHTKAHLAGRRVYKQVMRINYQRIA